MPARLTLQLQSEEPVSYPMASLFHGVLMELLPEEYADYLHRSQLHPYTQHIECREGKWYWVVTCLDQESEQIIVREVLWELNRFEIKNRKMIVEIVGKSYEELSYRELMNQFYEKDSERVMEIAFVTPTAFKQDGKYVFYPDLHCIFQSLMHKYDASVKNQSMIDEETLEQLTEGARIIRYDLRSVSFSMEGIRIPSFLGKVTIKMMGSQTMTNFAHMLLTFGNYSGVGIKTALGMGSIRLIEKEKRNNAQR